MSRTFFHTGDLGDIIASLPIVRAMGGGEYLIGYRDRGCRESLKGARFEAIKPLLEAQPYIERAAWVDTPPLGAVDFSTFRHDHKQGENLIAWQARHVGANYSDAPWLIAPKSPRTTGRTIFARSLRYHSPTFPWDKALNRFPNPLFVGLPDEYIHFQTKWGRPIENVVAINLLELAQMIAGAEMFVGNQSCPFWIAAGLGVPLIQESWAHDPNSVVERPNARYALNGSLPL